MVGHSWEGAFWPSGPGPCPAALLSNSLGRDFFAGRPGREVLMEILKSRVCLILSGHFDVDVESTSEILDLCLDCVTFTSER